ncbi:MAG: flavodoxin reductase [Rhodobacteraceae bacterium]|nr:flavodoxin reductase [Paracoccaceae bacterium]
MGLCRSSGARSRVSYELHLAKIDLVARRVHRLRMRRPSGFTYVPGQAVDITLARDGWRDEPRPFTIVSLLEDPDLEFLIKAYPDHGGVTEQIAHLSDGASVTVSDPWGALRDRGDGLFLAGGMGITPWLAILRARAAAGMPVQSTLLYAVEAQADLLAIEELRAMVGLTLVAVVAEDPGPDHRHGRLDRALIQKHLPEAGPVYLCGPPPMEEAVTEVLRDLDVGDDRVVVEG